MHGPGHAPLVLPRIATTAILCLVFSWNDDAFVFVVVTGE
jgi:ABC-type glycerol-3-phosphate transport system permease component